MRKINLKQLTVSPGEEALYTMLHTPRKQRYDTEVEETQLSEEWEVFNDFEISNDYLMFFDT